MGSLNLFDHIHFGDSYVCMMEALNKANAPPLVLTADVEAEIRALLKASGSNILNDAGLVLFMTSEALIINRRFIRKTRVDDDDPVSILREFVKTVTSACLITFGPNKDVPLPENRVDVVRAVKDIFGFTEEMPEGFDLLWWLDRVTLRFPISFVDRCCEWYEKQAINSSK